MAARASLRKQLDERGDGGDGGKQSAIEPDGHARFEAGEVGLDGDAFRHGVADGFGVRFGLGASSTPAALRRRA